MEGLEDDAQTVAPQVGQRVAPGTPLLAIVPLNSLWVDANFNVDVPGATSANLPTLGHTICARPMYPMEPDATFEPTVTIYRR